MDRLEKAKYRRRWKDASGKWRYEYVEPSKASASAHRGQAGYAERREAVTESKVVRAEKLESEAAVREKAGRAISGAIPMGQPILVGHHSEKRHRRDLKRMNANFHAAQDAAEKAKKLRDSAANPSAAISADDPEAVVKLKQKMGRLEQTRGSFKALNAAYRKHKGDWGAIQSATGLNDRTISVMREAMDQSPWEKMPIPAYKLTNMGAEIRRVKGRIADLAKEATIPEAEPVRGAGWGIHEDHDDNRIWVTFDKKPPRDVTQQMRSEGFKWSPTRDAWVRQLNNAGRYAAERVAKTLAKMDLPGALSPSTGTPVASESSAKPQVSPYLSAIQKRAEKLLLSSTARVNTEMAMNSLRKANDGKPGESLSETATDELKATLIDIKKRLDAKPDDPALQARQKAIAAELAKRGGLAKSGLAGRAQNLGEWMAKAKYTRRTGTPGNYRYEYANDSTRGRSVPSQRAESPKTTGVETHTPAKEIPKKGLQRAAQAAGEVGGKSGVKKNVSSKLVGALKLDERPYTNNARLRTELERYSRGDGKKATALLDQAVYDGLDFYSDLGSVEERKVLRQTAMSTRMENILEGQHTDGDPMQMAKLLLKMASNKDAGLAPITFVRDAMTPTERKATEAQITDTKGVDPGDRQVVLHALELTMQQNRESGNVEKSMATDLKGWMVKAGLPVHEARMGGPKSAEIGGSQDGGDLDGLGKTPDSNGGPVKARGVDVQGQVTGVPVVPTKKLSEDEDETIEGTKKPLEKMSKASLYPSPLTPSRQRDLVAHDVAVVAARARKGPEMITVGPQAHPFSIRQTLDAADLDAISKSVNGADIPSMSVSPGQSISQMHVLCKSIHAGGCDAKHSAMLTACPECGAGTVHNRVLPSRHDVAVVPVADPRGLRPAKRAPMIKIED